jgi:hypothetical protein
MPGEIERQLHTGRKFRKAFVDAELEVKGAILMPKDDGRCDRRIARPQRHDLALAAGSERRGRAPDKGCIAVVLDQRGAAAGFPAAGFESQKYLDRGCDFRRRARHIETDGAVLGQPMALAAQFLQFLGTERITQQFFGIAGGVKTGSRVGLQHTRMQAALPQRLLEGFHGCAVERHIIGFLLVFLPGRRMRSRL